MSTGKFSKCLFLVAVLVALVALAGCDALRRIGPI